MRIRVLQQGCAATWRQMNAGGYVGTALYAAHELGWAPGPVLLVAAAGIAHSTWWLGLAWTHNGWARGWWWTSTNHQCPGDDPGDDEDQPDPPPDDPGDEDQPDHHDTPTRISSSYTLAA